MLDIPVEGDINVILIKHLIAAKLNFASGSSSIEPTIVKADNFLSSGSDDKDYGEELKDILDEFNNSGDCD